MRSALLLMILLISAPPAIADELFVMGGVMRSSILDADDSSYSWQLEYRQHLCEHLAVSLSYLNEGHVPAHHRDGNALQLWVTRELISKRLSMSGGIGPYYYFDTTLPAANGSYTNEHGLGGIASLALIMETETPWLFQLRANWVNTFGQMDTVSALAGIGYRLDLSGPPKSNGDQAESGSEVTENEITLFVGRTITNSFESEHSTSLCLEYRRGLLEYLDWTASWIYEGDTRLIRRDGVASQFWAVKDFNRDRIALGFGVGTYFSIDRQAGSSLNGDRLVSMIATLTGSYRLDPFWSLRTSWNRIVTNYDRDTDVIMGGVGYRF